MDVAARARPVGSRRARQRPARAPGLAHGQRDGSQPTSRPRRATGGPTASRRITSAGVPTVTRPAVEPERHVHAPRPRARAGARRAAPSSPGRAPAAAARRPRARRPAGRAGSSARPAPGSAGRRPSRPRSPRAGAPRPRASRTLRSAERLDVQQVEHLLDAPPHVRRGRRPGSPCRTRARPRRGRARTRPRDPAARTPRRRPARGADAASVSRPATVTRPANVPPVKCGTSPFAARRNVDLPAPVGPSASANVPSSIVEVDVGERRPLARRGT